MYFFVLLDLVCFDPETSCTSSFTTMKLYNTMYSCRHHGEPAYVLLRFSTVLLTSKYVKGVPRMRLVVYNEMQLSEIDENRQSTGCKHHFVQQPTSFTHQIIRCHKNKRRNNKKQLKKATNNKQQATSNKQQATSNKQQATSSKQQATSSNQQSTISNQQSAISNQQSTINNQ